MALRPMPFAPDEWYHCYNRGVDKRNIVTNEGDTERFLMLLYACNSRNPIHVSNLYQGRTLVDVIDKKPERETLVDVGAYCLMSNHYHLLIREHTYGGITSFMRKVGTGYTMYFNIKYERTGALFQGKFKARHISTDQYFARAVSYVHANPAELIEPEWKLGRIRNEKRLREHLLGYRFSSLPDYLGVERHESHIIDSQAVSKILDSRQTIDQLIEEARIYARHAEEDLLPRSDLGRKAIARASQ